MVTVLIRAQDITGAVRGSEVENPVSRAVRATAVANFCVVRRGSILAATMTHDGRSRPVRIVAVDTPMPAALRDWLADFDAARTVSPTSFDLDLR